jgi:hypothetical protein
MIVRLLARAHHETWIVGAYLHLGGMTAFQRLVGSYAKELSKQQHVLAGHDEKLAAEHTRIESLNRSRRSQNDGIQERNRRTGEEIPLLPLVEHSDAEPFHMDFGPVLEELRTLDGLKERDLPVSEMAGALPGLATDRGYSSGQATAIYDLVYRGLSNLGSHTNYFVLEKYVDHSPERGTMKCRTQPDVPLLGEACLHGAGLLTSMLAQWILADRACDLAAVDDVVDRYLGPVAPADS